MSTIVAAVAAASFFGTPASAAPSASAGLYTLATTGWAQDYAGEVDGLFFDETGGKPGAFEYATPTDLSLAKTTLGNGEFLAPHFSISPNGDITVMVAPHLFLDGELLKGANVNKDHFVVISGGEATRYDYSEDVN